MSASRVVVALDYAHEADASALVERLHPSLCRLKVGKELFTAGGPRLVEALVARGYDVFLDLKYHDIPNTVAAACRRAADLGVWMLNVHALGGSTMMAAARAAIGSADERPLLIAVTVLTSLGAEDLHEVGIGLSPQDAVMRLAALAQASGMDGVVCSANEAPALRAGFGARFVLVTPGVRPAGTAPADQQRFTTPADAIALGADYLVIGRPITRAAEPIAALRAITAEIERAAAKPGAEP